MIRNILSSLLLLLSLFVSGAQAGQFDLGVGLGFVDGPAGDAFDGGWDIQAGYEFIVKEKWNFGVQAQITRGWTSENDVEDESDLAYASNALYATARPNNWWLAFKGGVVQADYTTIDGEKSETGVGLGAGIVIGDGPVRLHLLDYQRIYLGGDSFNVYTISLGIFEY